jgi:hypothetical protein
VADYETSRLWRAAFTTTVNGGNDQYRDLLRAEYHGFWERATRLASQIAADLPALTLHDEAHFVALWERASQLTGEGYDINPLETFVLGGAILLHDLGHAVATYPGRLAGIQATPEYMDALYYVIQKRRDDVSEDHDLPEPDESAKQAALLIALRRLHAQRAERLAFLKFGDQYLIGNSDLRDNLGQLIGQIAASHHWGRATLPDKLPEVQGPPGFMNSQWRIQPVKLACLLRCADAIQIDQTRAPSFAFQLHDPQGESRLHWLAQQLAQPVVEPASKGPGALVFTSQNDFSMKDADAWWVAYNLIRTANEELQGCFQLMADIGLPTFIVDRVRGAESPQWLAKHVRTDGWRPVSAEVRVSDVASIVRLFGGVALYGNEPAVALRELIQNAADAVRARGHLTKDPFYEGKIVVRLRHTVDDGQSILVVEDNGIGMSEHVLTGPLIEFGKSFWTSEDAQAEFPGLISSGLRQIGRFGIGFFSTLMLAKQIEVTSKRYDRGHAHTLTFREGIGLRPVLSRVDPVLLGQFSTSISMHVSDAHLKLLLHPTRDVPERDFSIGLKALVARLCPCLDCDVYVVDNDETPVRVHSRAWLEQDALEWLRDITLSNVFAHPAVEACLAKAAPFLRIVRDSHGQSCGRAAIRFDPVAASIASLGGLFAGPEPRSPDTVVRGYIGAMAVKAAGLTRAEGGVLADRRALQNWASDQAVLMADCGMSDDQRYQAAVNVANYGGDPTPIAMIVMNRNLVGIEEVTKILLNRTEVLAVLDDTFLRIASLRDYMQIGRITYRRSIGTSQWYSPTELEFSGVVLESHLGSPHGGVTFLQVPTEKQPAWSSFLSCLKRHLEGVGERLVWEQKNDALLALYSGQHSARDGLFLGLELRGSALSIRLQ